MPRGRGGILLALGLVLAIASGAMVYYLLQHAAPVEANNSALPTATVVPTRPLPVAAHALAAGATVTTTDVMEKDYPEDLIPVGVLTDTSTIIGQTVIEPIAEGEFIRPSQLGGNSQAISEQIAQGDVVMAFATDDLLNKSAAVRDGDHVDLLLTLDVKEGTTDQAHEGKATSYTVQNVKVLRVIRDQPTQDNPNPEPKALLFEMQPQDAVIAKFVKDSGGVLDFTLRSPLATEPFTTDSINQDFLVDKYGFRAPQTGSNPR
jgi:pilus assembly protein CpaB